VPHLLDSIDKSRERGQADACIPSTRMSGLNLAYHDQAKREASPITSAIHSQPRHALPFGNTPGPPPAARPLKRLTRKKLKESVIRIISSP